MVGIEEGAKVGGGRGLSGDAGRGAWGGREKESGWGNEVADGHVCAEGGWDAGDRVDNGTHG